MPTVSGTLTKDQEIAKQKAAWTAANKAGDKAGMAAAKAAADTARGYATTADGSKPLAAPAAPTNSTTSKTPTPTTTKTDKPAGSTYAAAVTGGGLSGQGATTIDKSYNPFSGQSSTAGDFNDMANKNIDPIRDIALKQGVDLGTAKAMYEADINNNVKGWGGEVYGSGNISDTQKKEYLTAEKINKDIVDANPYLTSVVNSAKQTAAGGQPNGSLLTQGAIVGPTATTQMAPSYAESLKGDKLGSAIAGATSGNIWDPQQVYNMIMSQNTDNTLRKTMSYEEAMGMAGDKLDPLYEDSKGGYLDAWSKNARQRGVYGQLPTDSLAATDLSKLENQKASDKATLAQSLIGQDKTDAMNEANQFASERNAKIQTLLSALQAAGMVDQSNYKKYMDALTYQDNKEQQALSNEMNMSQITGYFKGNPTIAYQKVLQDMALSKQELAERVASNKASISQGWARINADKSASKEQLALLKQQGIDAKDQQSYDMSISSKAYELAMAWMPKDGDGNVINNTVQFEKFYRDAVNKLTGNASDVFKMPGTGIQSGTSIQ